MLLAVVSAGLFLLTGCDYGGTLDAILNPDLQKEVSDVRDTGEPEHMQDYYEKFYMEVSRRGKNVIGKSTVPALDALPKDAFGEVDWTASVVRGLIAPKASLDPKVEDEPPLNLNIFIEAKVPLMANVIFPHSIHTYWLSCNNCSMDEIFKGEWCGRCHGKVAFRFWPRANCTRCHVILKGESRQKERWR
jgi:hypothetical protein